MQVLARPVFHYRSLFSKEVMFFIPFEGPFGLDRRLVPHPSLHFGEGDLDVNVGNGLYLARSIQGAKFVELPGADHWLFAGDYDSVLDEVELFLTGEMSVRSAPTRIQNPPSNAHWLSKIAFASTRVGPFTIEPSGLMIENGLVLGPLICSLLLVRVYSEARFS